MEPAADLGIALALVSSFQNTPLPDSMSALGEVGLGGELRNVSQFSRRLAELSHMGFSTCLSPESAVPQLESPRGINIPSAQTIGEVLTIAFPHHIKRRESNKSR